MRGRAFVLNLDAEVELAARGSYRRSAAMGAILAEIRPSAVRALLGPNDVCIDELQRLPADPLGMPGHAWCPTPSALAALVAVGAQPEPAPSLDVLRAANARRFSAELGQELPGARLCEGVDEVLALIAAEPRRTFLAKRDLSAAGRGRRKLTSARLDEGEAKWIRASLELGPLQVEPFVEIELELGTHGELRADGGLVLGTPTVQEVDASGAWVCSRLPAPGELLPEESDALLTEAERVGRALENLGYFGPFGVDAFRWRDDAGERRLCRRSEVNARYSMGWRTGGIG